MGVLTLREKRRRTRENCRILRPYILWKRRKENVLETDLILEIKDEEEKKKRDEEERKMQVNKRRSKRLQQLQDELTDVQERKIASKDRLKLLQEKKHELFLKLKNTLMAKETERREKHFKDLGDFYSNVQEYGRQENQYSQFFNPHHVLEQRPAFPSYVSQDASAGFKYTESFQTPLQDQQWQWTQSSSPQQYQQGPGIRLPNFRPPLQEPLQGQFGFSRVLSPKFQKMYK